MLIAPFLQGATQLFVPSWERGVAIQKGLEAEVSGSRLDLAGWMPLP